MSAIRQMVDSNPLNMLRLLSALAPQQIADRLSQLGIYVAPTEADVEKALIALAKKKEREKLKWLLTGLRIPADDLTEDTKQLLVTRLDASEVIEPTTKEADTDDNSSGDNNEDSGNNTTDWLELGVGVTAFLTGLFSFLSANQNGDTQNTGTNPPPAQQSHSNIWLYAAMGMGALMLVFIVIMVLKR